MKDFIDKTIILWDFDGVILDSMEIREEGFREVLQTFPKEEVDLLLDYHKKNGGLSRYVKFKYFFEEIRKVKVEQKVLDQCAVSFSDIMKKKLTSRERLNGEVINFIMANRKRLKMHIVSGSDGDELRYLCRKLGISDFFLSIEGSPKPKIELVENILSINKYLKRETCLIGDSINDHEAAEVNDIDFFGYNNLELEKIAKSYIYSFNEI
ncbi:HAD-IA family hydrolase [Salegentibacter sp. F188]|uniref:phosphoglycolate phosphatase n=1 Tax=Autumnicola patrickiae TaxID=3075591 RepID=A0ABU3E2C5_9FLAO|nr:HAD-IA family hydrolase [Salegentibacter sp. F188]MDT0689834.1 HAD-IA family hydrolase [Salegentibacter sp. F188]